MGKSQHRIRCERCGLVYDRRNITEVFVHLHQGPVPVLEGFGPGILVGPCRRCKHFSACEKLGVDPDRSCRHDPPKFEKGN